MGKVKGTKDLEKLRHESRALIAKSERLRKLQEDLVKRLALVSAQIEAVQDQNRPRKSG